MSPSVIVTLVACCRAEVVVIIVVVVVDVDIRRHRRRHRIPLLRRHRRRLRCPSRRHNRRAHTYHKPTKWSYPPCILFSSGWNPKNNRTRTGRARYQKWDHANRVQFWYGTLTTTVLELEEPCTGNETMRIEFSSGTGPSE